MERLIAVIGPTAVGKTRVSIDLATILHSEIISGDSMLVYKGMNIGTAKPTIEEQSGIPHHLINFLEPAEDFSVADFQQLATKHITDINNRHKIPILAGGTGLYVKALLEGYRFNSTPGNDQFRAQLEDLAAQQGNEYLHTMLTKVDAATAARLHVNDKRRIIRALEIHYFGGGTISQDKATDNLIYDVAVLGLTMDRATLYNRINRRVDIMIDNGLVEEVAGLLKKGIPPDCQAMQGIGYKEIICYLKGETDLQTAIDNIKQATRHFAKRQLTWYRKMPYIKWFYIDSFANYDEMMATFYNFIAGKFCI